MLNNLLHSMCVSEITYVHRYVTDAAAYPMHNRGRYRHCFLYTTEGTETYHFKDGSFRAVPDSVLYIPQNEEYRITFEGTKSVVYTMDFSLTESHSDRPFLIRFDRTNNVKPCFSEAERVWAHQREAHDAVCKSLFYKVVALLIDRSGRYVDTKSFEKIEPSVNYIHEHYLENDFRLDMLYGMADISPKYFTTLFRQKYGMTPKEYVTLLKIEYAKGLLASEKAKVKDIAIDVGYSDIFHFSRIFKAKTGCSPTEYKRKSSGDAE